MSHKGQSAEWRAAGLCCRCGRSPAPGHRMCERCVKWTREHCQTAAYMANKRRYNRTPKMRAYFNAYNSTRDMKEYFRLYNHRPKRRAKIKAWGKAHPDALRAAFRKWVHTPKGKAVMKSHVHKRRTSLTGAGGSFTPAEWAALKAKYNHRCLACGKRRKLTADHVVSVNNGGSSFISNIQPLCQPCNSRKGSRNTDYR